MPETADLHTPPPEETIYLALGGGMGSFIWVDNLLIAGANPAQVVAIGVESKPYGRFKRLCEHSQIFDQDRLRSDSGSTPDNIWGWPGYAVREIWQALGQSKLRQAARLAWQILAEPALAETYTPPAGLVYASLEREMARIGWQHIWRYGRLHELCPTDDGRYQVTYSQVGANGQPRYRTLIAPYVHLAMGYAGLRFLPDLQTYRAQTGDFRSIVNAYEAHEHLYEQLRHQRGTVLLRGRGIVASRVLQRLNEVRQQNPGVRVIHLMRSPILTGTSYDRAHRRTEHHWQMQPFNWPKACFGGDLRERLAAVSDEQRVQLLAEWGGTTTADRREWRDIVATGLQEGWYRICFGNVTAVQRAPSGRLLVTVEGERTNDAPSTSNRSQQWQLATDFILDSTGLNGQADHHPLLHNLMVQYGLARNALGNLAVTDDFEVAELRNGRGRLYAAGVITAGNQYAPVDSFAGLQVAAQASVDALVQLKAPGLTYLNGWRSVRQWWRWARGVPPQ